MRAKAPLVVCTILVCCRIVSTFSVPTCVVLNVIYAGIEVNHVSEKWGRLPSSESGTSELGFDKAPAIM
jgi:hypothetical protein